MCTFFPIKCYELLQKEFDHYFWPHKNRLLRSLHLTLHNFTWLARQRTQMRGRLGIFASVWHPMQRRLTGQAHIRVLMTRHSR